MAIYLDYNSTTPLDDRIRQAMELWLGEKFGNASSREHAWGWDAAEAVELARGAVTEFAGAGAYEITFTSGATEALNTVLRSYIGFGSYPRRKIITCATEHDAVLSTVAYLRRKSGMATEILPVDGNGHIDMLRLKAALRHTEDALVVIMAANNEIGTIHPVREIAQLVHEAAGSLLCDTAQAFGKLPVDVTQLDADFVTISAHKIYGPKGVGALLARRNSAMRIEPLIVGGGQERGDRGGTLNVPGIVGLGEACRILQLQGAAECARIGALRDQLEQAIVAQVSGISINGDPLSRLSNTTNIGFDAVDARTLIRDMHDIGVSTRSACASGNEAPSHVLKAIGLSDAGATSCVRFSLGRFTTAAEIEYTIKKVAQSVPKVRTLTSSRN